MKTEGMEPNYEYKPYDWANYEPIFVDEDKDSFYRETDGSWVKNSFPFNFLMSHPDFEVRPIRNETDHYTQSEIECVDYLWDNMPFESFVGGLEWNIKKYLHRWRYKENPVKDLRKARDYLNVLIDVSEGKPPKFEEWK